MGEFTTDTTASAKYKVAIAGGAGVLAFCVAYGIIQFSPQMRDAFQTEKKFVRVLIKSADGSSNIPSYAPTFIWMASLFPLQGGETSWRSLYLT
jgi:hypothetical protein